MRVIADRTVARMSDFVCGANADGFHLTGVNWGRDLPEPALVADLRNVVAGDPSPDGRGTLAIQRGIEVGHVFYLGTKYSAALKATYLDEDGSARLLEMGCYGIGVTRLLGAAIEQNHDARGIIWPAPIAPFTVVHLPRRTTGSPRRCARPPTPCTPELRRPASTCCSTTAASVPARCSPMPNSSACRTGSRSASAASRRASSNTRRVPPCEASSIDAAGAVAFLLERIGR